MMGGYSMGIGGGILGLIYMLLPLLLLGAIVYLAVKAATGNAAGIALRPVGKAVEIAEERYAKGEISFSDLQEIRGNLQKK